MHAQKHETKTPSFAQSEENLNDPDGEAARIEKPVRKPGFLAGKIWIADDFDAPLDDLFECRNTDKPTKPEQVRKRTLRG